MLQLNRYFRAVFVAFIRHHFKAVYRIVRKETRLSRTALGFAVDYSGFDGNETEAALGSRRVICLRSLAERTVCISEIISHRRSRKAVRNLYCADFNR